MCVCVCLREKENCALINFFLNTHLGYSFNFTVVYLCQIKGGIPPPIRGILGKNRSTWNKPSNFVNRDLPPKAIKPHVLASLTRLESEPRFADTCSFTRDYVLKGHDFSIRVKKVKRLTFFISS